ncbi:SpoIIIAH-like family protein [Paucisalibacillus globulus]|uniref:SpoIIIAH-like family protein n=1 Tax=Paucisalibacillus globulus TaxID=351095 RepID=UPI00040FAD45|nr:SpoIIIAH-like family protein [Paucisalibacillus globulus]
MLKKQTVWLLTMLSLMIVLSVYYMTQEPGDLAFVNKGEENDATEKTVTTGEEANVDVVPGGNELFAALRLEVQEKRDKKLDRLDDVLASSTASVEEKKQATDEMDQLDQLQSKEGILEEVILASAEYQDVFVRADDGKVFVHVQGDELSNSEVLNIMQLVHDELGDVTVTVVPEPMTES